jgi:hypothetical protein
MNKPFTFLVRDAQRQGIVGGEYRPGAGVSFPMEDGPERDLLEAAVTYIANEPACVGCTLDNGWEVTAFDPRKLSVGAVNRFNKSR